jgi:hypothetical protein
MLVLPFWRLSRRAKEMLILCVLCASNEHSEWAVNENEKTFCLLLFHIGW